MKVWKEQSQLNKDSCLNDLRPHYREVLYEISRNLALKSVRQYSNTIHTFYQFMQASIKQQYWKIVAPLSQTIYVGAFYFFLFSLSQGPFEAFIVNVGCNNIRIKSSMQIKFNFWRGILDFLLCIFIIFSLLKCIVTNWLAHGVLH